MTHTIDMGERAAESEARAESFDPAVGAAGSLLGLVLMGAGGARVSHHVFHVGMAIAVGGAALCVLLLALSALSQRAIAGK